MRQTMRWMAAIMMVGALGVAAQAQDRPGMPAAPGGASSTTPGKAPAMPSPPGSMPAAGKTTGSGMPAPSTPMAGAVNVNTADEAAFTKLKGIGPVKAKAIMAYRQQNGPFKSLDDLTKVEGIGKKTLESLKDQIVVQ